MKYLSLAALKVALADLFGERHATLLLSSAGKTYESILLERKQRIDDLPGILTGGKPLAEAMAEADDVHDGYGGAIWHLTEAYARCPKVPAEVRAAVGRVREGSGVSRGALHSVADRGGSGDALIRGQVAIVALALAGL